MMRKKYTVKLERYTLTLTPEMKAQATKLAELSLTHPYFASWVRKLIEDEIAKSNT